MNARYILLAGLVLASATYTTLAEPVDIGGRREVFWDYALIDSMTNAAMVLHEPQYEGPAFAFDESWEGPFSGYPSIVNDNGLLRMYYRARRVFSSSPSKVIITGTWPKAQPWSMRPQRDGVRISP